MINNKTRFKRVRQKGEKLFLFLFNYIEPGGGAGWRSNQSAAF